jgi:hypothetical protein
MGLTLLEAAKSEQDELRRGLYQELSAGELSGIIPFVNSPGQGVFYNKVTELPQVGFRGINEALDATYGVINPESEGFSLLHSDIDVDRFEINTIGEEVMANQVSMKMQSMRMLLEHVFINGDTSVDARTLPGLRQRINIGSSQAINGNGALSLQALDELIDATDANGGRKVLIMNQRMNRLLTAASRATGISGFITYEQNEFGRRARFYNDVEIVTTKVGNTNQLIMPFSETTGGAASGGDRTSIYCVSFGDDLVTMHQGIIDGNYGPSVRDLGEVDGAPRNRVRFEWYVLMTIKHGRAASRLYNVSNAAVTV